MNKTTITTSGVVTLLIVAAGVAWAVLRPDPKVEEVKQLQQEMFANRENSDEDQRHQLREQYEQARKGLNESQQQEVRQSGREFFRARMEGRMDDFLALEESQRTAYLDEDIQRFEERRKQWQQRRKDREASGEGGPNSRQRKGDGRRWTNQDRDERFRRILDNTTPEMRAKFTVYMQALNERRKELGMEEMRRPPFRGGGRGGRPRPESST